MNTAAPFASEDVPAGTSVPVIGNVLMNVSRTAVTVSFTTDRPAAGRIEFGRTAAYAFGSSDTTPTGTTHLVRFEGLAERAVNHYRIWAVGAEGTANSGDRTLSTIGTGRDLWSDDFNRCSVGGGMWTFVDPPRRL